jgi:hypothetical protein
MEELMDLIATNESPSQVSDKIKDLLFSKSAERLENMRSAVASQLFGENESEEESEDEDDEEDDGDEDN